MLLLLGCKKKQVDNINNSTNFFDTHMENIMIYGIWEAELGGNIYKWCFNLDDSYEYYKNGTIVEKGNFLYIDLIGDSYSVSEGDLSANYETQRWDELLLLQDNSQKVISGIYSDGKILRMKPSEKIIYYINSESSLLN